MTTMSHQEKRNFEMTVLQVSTLNVFYNHLSSYYLLPECTRVIQSLDDILTDFQIKERETSLDYSVSSSYI